MDIGYIGIVGSVVGLALSYLGYRRGQRDEENRNMKQYQREGAERGTVRTDLEYIKRRSDDLLLEHKETNKHINALNERLTRVEESNKAAHRRIDHLE